MPPGLKFRISLIGLVFAAVALLAVMVFASMRQHQAEVALKTPVARATPTTAATAASAAPPLDPSATTPEAVAYRKRLQFEQDARSFLRDAKTLGSVERSERARALSEQINLRERAGEMSAGEAVVLRMGLIEATIDDEIEQYQAGKALFERYRADTARRQAFAQSQQANDPRYQRYKAMEAQIATEVMAMPSIPGDMSRDEYLRLRLQQAREAAYGR